MKGIIISNSLNKKYTVYSNLMCEVILIRVLYVPAGLPFAAVQHNSAGREKAKRLIHGRAKAISLQNEEDQARIRL
jgi:hypothetical protein